MSIIKKKENNLNQLIGKLNSLTLTYSQPTYEVEKIKTEKNQILRQKIEIENKNQELLREHKYLKQKILYDMEQIVSKRKLSTISLNIQEKNYNELLTQIKSFIVEKKEKQPKTKKSNGVVTQINGKTFINLWEIKNVF